MSAQPPRSTSVVRQLATLAWPVIGLNVLNVLALVIDTAMVGRLDGAEDALVGLGFATQLLFLLMVFMMGLTVGTVAQVARAFGAGQHDRVVHLLRQSSQLTLLVGVGVAVSGNLLAGPMLWALGAEGAARVAAEAYLRPLLWASVFSYLNILYAGVLRGVGNTRLALFVAVMVNLINVGLNYGLILGNWGMPALGVQGAAYGTACAQAAGAILMAGLLVRGVVPRVRLSLRPAPIDRPLAAGILRVGAPAAMDMVVLNLGFLVILGLLGRVAPLAVAAHAIGLRLQALAFVPGIGVSQATSALVGQALGADDLPRARKVVRASLLLCTGIMSVLGGIILFLDAPILAAFDVAPGSELFELSRTWMSLLGLMMPLAGIYVAFVGVFQGAGATRITLGINAWSTLLVQIPLSWVLGVPLGLGAFGVWLAFPIAFVLKAAMAAVHYRRDKWAVTGDAV